MHDPSSASTRPRGQATPPPLPQRVEPCVEAVTRTQTGLRLEQESETRAEAGRQGPVDKAAEVRTEPPIQLRIEPLPTPPAGDYVPATLSPQKKQALYWGGGGFITGVVFWHAVGFWDVVHSAIFSGTPIEASRTEKLAPKPVAASAPGSFADAIDRAISSVSSEAEPAPIATGALQAVDAADNTNCASFTRDFETGQVQSRPCSGAERMLPENPDGGRRNFASQRSAPADSRWIKE